MPHLIFPDTVQEVEVATANLLCAEGLGANEPPSIPTATAILDNWAARVKSETERHLYKLRQNPAEYQNSEAYFKILVLITVLQQDFGIHYNPQKITAPDFSDPDDLFLRGLLGEKRTGTCVSMPVLYVAIGRRLGYPMKLVTAKAHLFARWEGPDGKERLNIEATNQGLNCFPDEYYRNWPVPMSEEEYNSGHYLRSLTPEEELALFLSTRGHCLEAQGRLPEAQLAHAQTHVLAPKSPIHLAFLASAVKRELPDWHRVQVDLGQYQTRSPKQP
jgi:regulator of sirC expression with transglutaminase-like and TPR domain